MLNRKETVRLYALVTLAFYLLAFSVIVSHAVLPEWITTFEITPGRAGRVFFVYYLTYVINTLLSGVLSDRFGKKPVLVLGQLFLAVGTFLVATAHTFPVIEAGMLVMGLGGGFNEAPLTGLISEKFIGREGTALNLSQISFGVGAASGPLLAGILLDGGFSWRIVFLIPAGVFAFLLTIFLLEKKFFTGERKTFTRRGAKALVRNQGGFLVISFLAMFLYVGSEIGSSSWMGTYVVRELGGSFYAGGLSIAGFWGMITVGRLLFAFLARYFSYSSLLRVSSVVSLAFLVLVQMSGQVNLAILSFMGLGLGYSAIWPLLVAVVASKVESMKATAISMVVAFGGLGALVFPWLLGILGELLGLRSIFIVVTVLVGGLAVVFWSNVFGEKREGTQLGLSRN
ncbi:MAG TPA: MFS transporter [Atribacteraceae bacterium]|nr:MFS transporter [Atribacteraceae bacterium]